MHTRSGLLTRTGTRLLATAAVLIAITGLMLAGRATPVRAVGATNGFFGFSATASSVVEGGATSLIVNRSGGSAGTVTVSYYSTPGTGCPASVAAQADLTNGLCVYGYLTFAGGETSRSILVQTVDLATVEGSRTVTFALTGADGGGELAGGSTGSHVVTITDNDGPSTYSYGAATQSAAEAAGLVNVPVIRNGSTALVASVTCTITSGTAATPADFTLTTPLASFAIGQTTANCQLTIVNDTTPEPDETIVMGFTGASGFGSTLATTVTIVDDDGPGTLQFSQATYTVSEGVGTAAIAVSRTAGSSGTVTIQCSTTGGTATASPAAGYDYTTVTNQVLTWLDADATPKYCYIVITGDTAVEGTETITLGLTGITGSAIPGAQSTATVNITDDDSSDVLAFSAATYLSNEGTSATITVTRTGTLAGTVGVSYSTSNGSAIAGSDYTAAAGTLSFGPSVVAQTFTVSILNDAIAESTETVVLTLSGATGGASIGSPSTATLNILDGTTGVPTITLLSPASGPIGGGNTITITGTNLSGTTLVAFGSQVVAPSTVSATSVTVIVPLSSTSAAQTVEVVVTTPAGSSVTATTANDYTYTAGPTITFLSPATGPTSGLTTVIITGTGFTIGGAGMTLSFGGTLITSFTVGSTTSITAISPAHSAGVVNVIVTVNSIPSPDTVADDFTYTGASIPAITSISPTTGPIGTSVTVTGSGFTGATSVTVGGLAAAFTVVTDSSLTVTVPAGTANGVVDIRVTGPGGTSPNVTADDFTNTSTSGATTTYTLYFRWSLISWSGIDNISASNAVKGIETGTANPATNDVSASVTAIWYFDGPSQSFKGYFVGYDNTPGANDFTTLRRGVSYWIAISTAGSVSWTVLQGS